MRIRNLELTVGVFILAGVLALTVLALRVAGLTPGSTGSTYSVHAYFDNVAGLTSRAKVTMSGVTIPLVRSLPLNSTRIVTVRGWIWPSTVTLIPCLPTAPHRF